jgi:hypothetical protein
MWRNRSPSFCVTQVHVELFFNPEDALSHARELARNADVATPNLLISDYRFGASLNGIASLSTLRATFKQDILAILLTGDTSIKALSRIERELTDASATTQLLHKPVSGEALIAALNSLIKQH